MNDQLLGDGVAPKATVNAKTDMNTFSRQDLGNSGLPAEPNYEVGISDIGKSTLSAGLRSISGIAEIGNQNVKALENKANKDDGFVSDIANAMTYVPIIPIADKVLPKLRDGLSSVANSIDNTLSSDAKKAAQTMPVTKEGDEWRFSSDPAVFGMNFANVVGYMLPTVATAFATRGQSLAALEPALTRAMIRTGASKAVAEKALPYVVNALKSAPATTAGITSDLGSQGNDMRRQALDSNFDQLSESKYFREAFSDIDSNPETASLTDGQKLSLARERVADFASRATISDPKNIAASAAATMLGDVPLANAALKGLKTTAGGLRGAAHGFISGGLREAPLEGMQEGIQQKVSNNVSNQYLGSDIDPNQGVDKARANGALLGFLSGGSLNAIGGLRGEHEQAIEPETQTGETGSPDKVDEEPETTPVDVSVTRDLNEEPQDKPTHAQHGYTKEEAIDDLNAPAYLREELRNQAGPQPDLNTGQFYDVDDLSIPAYLRNGKEINEDPETHERVSEPNTKEQSFSHKEGAVTPKTFDETYLLDDGTTTLDTVHHMKGKNDIVVSDVPPSVIYGHDQRSKVLAQNNDDKQVGYPEFDGGLKKSQRRELEYLAKRRANKIPSAMQNLKGAARITRPEYREELVQLADQSSALSHNKVINHQLDTVTSAITKLGGINRDLAKSEGIDEAHFKRNQLFPTKGGRTFDEMAEVLNEHGFTARSGKSLSANDVLDLVGGELDNNERHYSNQSDAITETDKGSALAELVREYGNERIQIAIKKALKGERLGDRQGDIVNEAMDVIETGRIEQAGGIESRRNERDMRRASRQAKREQKLKQASQDLGLPDWVTSDYSMNLEQEYSDTVESLLDDSIYQASSIDHQATEHLIKEYEVGKLTTAQLISKLGEIDYADQQAVSNMEDAKPITEITDTKSAEERTRTSTLRTEQKAELEHDAGAKETVEQDKQNLGKNKSEPKSTPETEEGTQEHLDKEISVEPTLSKPHLVKNDIQDVGEKIGGARKDIWESYSSTVEGHTKGELQSLPLSKSWPQPNYQAMLNQGGSLDTLSLFRAIRDSITAKPRSGYKVSRWANNVHSLREVALKVLDGSITKEQADTILKTSTSREAHKITGRAALYQAMGLNNSLSGFTVSQGEYSLFNGQQFNPPKTIWTVERTTKSNGLNHWPRMMSFGDTQAEAIEKFKHKYQELSDGTKDEPKLATFDIYTKYQTHGYFIGKKVGRSYVDLEGPIDSIKEARRILNEENERLSQKLAREKYVPALRGEENYPRVGEDMRQGSDVSADDFANVFGFRGVEFGNWVDQKKRQTMVNEAYDALMDMAAVLNISPKAISLNGELGLAFGARGIGGKNAAKAHYEPGKVVINLTKKKGAGSLGHEWWHALDNYFGKMDVLKSNPDPQEMMTLRSLKDRKEMVVRAEMRAAFKGVMDVINDSDLVKRSKHLDKTRSKDYWSTPEEMSARSFESYLIAKLADQNVRNDFLANIVKEPEWNDDAKENGSLVNSYPYPNKAESKNIRSSFDHLFNTIEENKFDDGHVMLFSRESFTPESKNSSKGMPVKQARLAVQSWLRQYKGGAGVSIKVVQTQAEAEHILGAKLDGYKINAFYDEVSASVVVVADNIANTKELRKKLRHEILVHHGLRAVVGDTEYGRILKMVYSGLESKHLKPLIHELEQHYNRSDLNSFVEEVLAHVAEKERNTIQQWYDRIVSSIAQALRKVGLMSQSDITKAELHNIVQTLTERIKSVNEWGPGTESPKESGHGRLSRTKFSKTKAADGLFDRDAFLAAVDKVRKITQGTTTTTTAGFDIPTENLKSQTIRKLADKFQVLKALQKNIAQAGGKVDENNDVYLAEELFHGKSENDLRLMKEKYIQPLADKMAKFNINQAKLDEYLIARHAQERNAYIAKINPKFPDGGSGMTNSDAAAKLDEIRQSGKQKQYDELVHIIDAMIAKQRDVIKASGLESNDLVDTWQSHYKHYVPLKGIAKDEPSSARTGKGFSIGGKESKTAKGRQSMAESPSSHAIIDLTEKLIRAQKNEVGNTLLKLVQDNPSPDYWQVFTNEHPDTVPDIVERKNAVTGEKERTVIDRAVPMAMMSDYYFPTKKDGKVYYIKLHDSRLMNAMKNMGPDTSNGVIRTMAKVNRFLATVNTSYNPEFVVGNFARDIQTAFLNLSAEQTRDDGKIKGQKVVKHTIKDIPKAMRAVYASLREKSLDTAQGKEWQSYFEDFMSDGAKTGWFDMKDVDGQAKELDRMVAMASGTTKGRAYKLLSSTTGFIENLNGAVENAVRLSAYVNARKSGISRKKAASLAKNMTVNFNRRGEVGTTLNAMYMFANASVQGSVNFMRTMYGLNGDGKLKWKNLNQAQKIAMGVVAGSFALSFANRNSAGNDEDGQNWFDKVPNYVKERNFIIMKSLLGGEQDGSYWSIPMPYGYNIFALLGSGVESAANSDYLTKAQVTGNIVLATLSSFSPIGLSESNTVTGTILKNVAPTITKPFLDVGLNENFYGGQVYKENMPFGTPLPESSLSKMGTSEHYKYIAKWLNQVTGGSEFRSGGIDVSPDILQYMVGYLGGAALRFADVKVPGLIDRLEGEEVEPSQVAFLSRLSGRVMPYEDQQKFYQRRDELMQIADEANSLSGAKRQAFMGQYKQQLKLMSLLKSTDKQLKNLRKKRDIIYALNIPPKDKELRIKNVEREMKSIIDKFNFKYPSSL
ncbi:LPD5 domain-containing protein [Photobacterium damselae subsp. damselae]|uniref:LPD5 domain-containing protein n=1 Tax=Photobacterium damselae TaxID=38293 RepID=UPI001F46244A|nr:LPD5 domain-containing protein [Photobacterium damselae]UKA27547.1 LPD5 domain-containing protein [Photobacterium damselae subsp. damselae]